MAVTRDCVVCAIFHTFRLGWISGTTLVTGVCKHRQANCVQSGYKAAPRLFVLPLIIFSPLLIFLKFHIDGLFSTAKNDAEIAKASMEIVAISLTLIALFCASFKHEAVAREINGLCAIVEARWYYGIESFLPPKTMRMFHIGNYVFTFFLLAAEIYSIVLINVFSYETGKYELYLTIAAALLNNILLLIIAYQCGLAIYLHYIFYSTCFERIRWLLERKLKKKKKKATVVLDLEIPFEAQLKRLHRLYLCITRNYEILNQTIDPHYTFLWTLIAVILVISFYYVLILLFDKGFIDVFVVVRNVLIILGAFLSCVVVQEVNTVVRSISQTF